jgi:UDP:flavonoid glycosyltransferase YjiC (YdhE family)
VNLRTATPSARAIRSAYDRLTTEPSFRDAASRVGAQLQSSGGTPRAVELLEELVDGR